MIKTESKVTGYEVDGVECKGLDMPALSVSSHGIRNDRVVLEFGGKRITVVARDLNAAVSNATNTGR